MRPAAISHEAPGLYRITLPQDLPGFEAFIAAWLYRGKTTLLLDPGPAASAEALATALDRLGVRRLDAILLTHVHIDHAGGTADLRDHFPDTPVVCHPKALRHLQDPSRLWEGSLKALGDTARAYGSIRPLPTDCLIAAGKWADFGVRALPTPGHAPHHVSYLAGPWLFCGEAGGVCLRTPAGGRYLRPATPARFFLGTSLESIDNLRKIPHSGLCYGHLGLFRNTPELLDTHRAQLLLWAREIEDEIHGNRPGPLVERCRRRLLNVDPLLAGLQRFDRPVRARETYFIDNSIRGFLGYLQEGKGSG